VLYWGAAAANIGACLAPPTGCLFNLETLKFTAPAVLLAGASAYRIELWKPSAAAWVEYSGDMAAGQTALIETEYEIGLKARWAAHVNGEIYVSDEIGVTTFCCEGKLPPSTPDAPTLEKDCVGPVVTVTSPAFSQTEDAETERIEIQRSEGESENWITVHTFTAEGEWDDETVLAALEYSYRARACNDAGCSAWSTPATISLESTGLQMTFTQPAPDSSLRDVTELLLELSDAGENECGDSAVTFENFFDGNSFALNWVLISGTPRNGVYRAYWDAREFPSGSGVLRVTANGRDVCRAKAELPLVLDGLTNPLQACWWSKKLPTAALQNAFPTKTKSGQDRFYKRVTPSLVNPVRALDDADNYVYTLAVNVPGDSTDLADYQLLEDKRHSLFLEKGQTFRLVMCREPLLKRLTYPLDAQSAIRLHAYNDGKDKLAILTQNPNTLLSFDGNDVSLLADLSEYSGFVPLDVAFLDGRFYVVMSPTSAGEPHLRVVDLDDTDRPYRLLIDEDNSPLTAIARWNNKIWVAATTGLSEATIYSFGGGDLQRPVAVASLPPVVRFDTRSGASDVLRAACEGGGVYEITTEGAELIHATGQSAARSLYGDGAVIYAGTSDAGKLFTDRGGNWNEEKEFAELSGVLALAPHRGSVFAGGDSGKLFQRRQGVWGEVDELAGVSSINDMAEFGDLLVLATSAATGNAFLHARRVASAQGVIAREIPQIALGLELGE
jgi:hypothetical protein